MATKVVTSENLAEFATKLNEKQKTIFAPISAVGAPLTAETAAGMTDETKVYVYTGEEVGYTYGNWYYYDGTGWVSGGVYNATVYETDTTLSESGKPADAKAAGDDIRGLEEAVDNTAPAVIRRLETETGTSIDNVWMTKSAAAKNARSVIVKLVPQQSGTPSEASPAVITGFSSYSVRIGKGNLFEGQTEGVYIGSDGSLTQSSDYRVTDFIDVRGMSAMRFTFINPSTTNRTARVAFYDADYKFISGTYYAYSSNNTKCRNETLSVPSGAVYMRFGCVKSNYLLIQGDSWTVGESFPEAAGTVYGGYVDVTNGKLVVTKGNIASYDGEELPGKWISSMDEYTEGGTPTSGAQVVYDLAEPVEYDITAHDILMFRNYTCICPFITAPSVHGASVMYDVADLLCTDDLDTTLTESGKPADSKSAGDGIRVNAEAIESLVGSSLFPFTYNWDYQKTEAKPYGWRQGYYRTDDGEFTDSSTYKTNYLCNNTVIIRMFGAAAFSIEAPQNYWVKISKYKSSDGTYVGVLATVPAGEKQYFILDDNGNDYHYRYTCGNFNGSSASYLNDDFIKSIKLVIYNRTQKQIYYKKYEDDNAFFTVTVDRPLTFEDENVVTGTEEIECAFKMPASYRSTGKPTRMILACHGSEGYIKASTNHWGSGNYKPFMQAMVDAGYGVFDANIFETSTGTSVMGKAFGSPMYINVLKKAYDYLLQNYNIYPEIFVHGISMGGLGATAFAHAYPSIVLAESSFAGRSILTYLSRLITGGIGDGFGVAYGYESNAALADDEFSRVTGVSPELSIIKYVNGAPQLPPDRATDYDNWLAYFAALADLTQSDEVPDCIGHRSVPYKAWNSWADNEGCTKLEEVLKKAYTTGNSAPYYTVTYYSGTHADMCYGAVNNMRNQLLCWFKRWE